jgi:hypothetical protein
MKMTRRKEVLPIRDAVDAMKSWRIQHIVAMSAINQSIPGVDLQFLMKEARC